MTVLATTVLGLSIANTGVGDTTSYRARFTDATGLVVGDSVRIAGVKVGQVESIEVVDTPAGRRSASPSAEGATLPASVTASIKYLNMVGQRYIDLDQGAGPRRPDLQRRARPSRSPAPHPRSTSPSSSTASSRSSRDCRHRTSTSSPARSSRSSRARAAPSTASSAPRRLADHHRRGQGQGDRRGDQEPQHGPEDRQRPGGRLRRPRRHPPEARHRLLRRPQAARRGGHGDGRADHRHRGPPPGRTQAPLKDDIAQLGRLTGQLGDEHPADRELPGEDPGQDGGHHPARRRTGPGSTSTSARPRSAV